MENLKPKIHVKMEVALPLAHIAAQEGDQRSYLKSHMAPTWATTHTISHGGGGLAPPKLIACVVAPVATKLDH